MSEHPQQKKDKAAELFAQAREREAQQDYRGARKYYEESLRLHEDEAVRKAYLKLITFIGPK